MQDIKAKHNCMQETGALKVKYRTNLFSEEMAVLRTVAAISKQTLALDLKQDHQFCLSLYYNNSKFQSSVSFLLCTIILNIHAGVEFNIRSALFRTFS